MTYDGSHSYTYDAENRITKVDAGATASYMYDAQGRRVRKTTPSLWTDYIYDLAGNVVSEYTSGPATCGPICWNASHIYFNGRLLADYKDGTTYFAHKDHLGSTRLLTAAGLGTRIQSSGGTSTVPYYFSGLCPSASGASYSIFVWVKNQGTTSMRIGANIVDGPVIAPGTTQRVNFTGTGDGTTCVQLRFETLNPGDPMDVVAFSPSINASGTQLIPPANSNFSAWNTYGGSSVTLTQGQGFVIDSMDYLPYGEQIAGAAYTTHKFTGKERDSETNLDYLGARYYSNGFGRFMTPDPLLNSGQPWNPQSWNRYSYTYNNPMRYTDPTGLYVWGDCTGTEEKCKAEEQRFKDSIAKAKEALKHLDPKSKEAKELKKTLNKLGDEGKGHIQINFGYAGETNGEPNAGRTIGNSITINYDEVDKVGKDWTLNPDEKAALDAGVTTHEGTHAGGGPSILGFLGVRGEHAAYFVESATYQGLHNTDKPFRLWNESWLKLDQHQLEQTRENHIQDAMHPDRPPRKDNEEK